MVVALDCTALILTVRDPLAPRSTLVVAGNRETMVGRFGVTVIVLCALLPLRLAVITAVPAVFAATAMGALVWPAGTVMVAGTEAIPATLLERVTVVALAWTALMVTVREPVPPCVTVSVGGCKLATVGGTALTSTTALADPPLSETVTCELPTLNALTGIGMLVWPIAKLTLPGTVAIEVLLLATASEPAVVGLGEIVAVNVPDEPTVRLNGFGDNVVGVGRIFVPNTLIVR